MSAMWLFRNIEITIKHTEVKTAWKSLTNPQENMQWK